MRFIVVCIGLFLAIPALAKKPDVQDPAVLAATHGYVYINFPKKDIGALGVEPVSGGKAQLLERRTDPGKTTYGLWLPAGQYQIQHGPQHRWEDYPPFEIKAGRITDMGSLLQINMGGYEMVSLPVRHADYEHDIDLVINEFAKYLVSTETIRWEPVAPPKPFKLSQPSSGLGLVADLLITYERKVNRPSVVAQLKNAKTNAEFLQLARLVTPPLGNKAVMGDGKHYFGGDMGVVRVRNADGSWDGITVNTLHRINTVEYADNKLVTGSDDGFVRMSADGGKTWATIKSFGVGESILDIDNEGATWMITTGRLDPIGQNSSSAFKLSVYIARSGDFSDIVKLREFPLDLKKMLGWFGSGGKLVRGKYYINTFFELHIFDVKSGQWKTTKPDTTISMHSLDPKTGTLSVFMSKGAFSKIFISSDDGDTWKKVGRPPYIINDVQFDSATSGFASRWNMNAFSGVWEIYSYNSAIDDWNKVSEAPFNCRPVRVSLDMPSICIANNGSIFSQNGSQWVVEFSTQ